jgi:hypothetical protein
MAEDRDARAPTARVRQYRAEMARILATLGHPEAPVTDESRLRDFPLREDDEGPSLTELRIDLGVRVRRDDRLVDIAQRMRAHAQALLLCLLQAIDQGTPLETLRAMVDGWRQNAYQALAADDSRATVDQYLEVSVDARLYLLARPELLDDSEDEEP